MIKMTLIGTFLMVSLTTDLFSLTKHYTLKKNIWTKANDIEIKYLGLTLETSSGWTDSRASWHLHILPKNANPENMLRPLFLPAAPGKSLVRRP